MYQPRLCGFALVVCLLTPAVASAQKLVTAGGQGTSPAVRVFDASGTDQTFLAYPAGFRGGVRVALGDVTGDGVLDIITGAGPGGGPHVRVWNGTDLTEVGGFFAYDPAFPGGVFVAAGDVNGDGKADIITGAGPGGGPHVRIWDGATFAEIGGFFAYDPAFPGGVNVAAADINGDGLADIITGAGPGGGPHVRVWNVATLTELGGFFAYDPAFPGGVNVAAADVDGDGRAEIVTGAGPGGGPHVRVWNGTTFVELGGFYAYDPAFPGGVVVGTVDLDRDGRYELVTGPALGAPLVRLWTGTTFLLFGEYFAYDPAATNGVFVGSLGGASPLRFTSASSTTFTAGTASTFSVTTSGGGTPPPTLTVTGTLPAGVTFIDNGDRTATLAGTPGAGTGGSHPLTFTATLSGRPPVTRSFTLTINQAPAITSAAATTFSRGAPGTFTVTTTGVPAPQLTVAGPLPSGVTFIDNGNGTGTLSGTPAAGTGGPYVLAISASNGIGTGTIQNFMLTVSGAPAIASATTTTFTVGNAGTFTVTAVGTPTPALTVLGALPAGVTFVDNGNGTGTLSGTPAAGTGGTYPITFTAANGVLPNGTQAFTLNVNQAPAITNATGTTFTVGAAGSFTVTTSGFPAAALTRGGAALPAGVTFVDNGNGTGTLSGTPAAGTGGTFAITFTATNTTGATAPQAFTLTVNGAPTFTSASTTTFTVASAGTFTVSAVGPPMPAISVTGALPAGVTFVDNGNGTGTLSGTPAAGTGGTYAITFTAANGVLPNGTQAFTLNVNQAPAITSVTSTTFSIGTAGSFTVTTSGFPAPTVTIGGAALPAGITFVYDGNGTGTLSGTPAAGTGGTYAITFTATNTAGSSALHAFTLTVNQAPTITTANTTSFTVGVAGTFTVTTTASPVAAITRTGVALPGNVTFVDNGDGTGTLSGTPAAGTAGAYAFTFTAANGVPPDAVQAFTLNVQQAPAITSAAATTFTVGTPGTFTVTMTGFPTPTVTQTGTLPTGVAFTSATRVLAGTATQTGVFPLQFTAANGVPPDAVENFTLNVVCPAITVTPGTMTEGLYQTLYGGVDFNQAGSTGAVFTWAATGLPAGLSINGTTGVVSGTPTNTVLNGAVVVTVTDNFGCQGTVNATITVRPTTDNENYAGGVGHTQYIVGAPIPGTPHVFANDNVKIGDSGPGVLLVTFPATSPNGAIVEGATDGTFTYTPNLNFAGPSDSFTYTLTDGNGVTNTGTVTINLSGLVWYVNSAGGAGDGRSHNPFNTLNAAATPSATGSFIYVHSGGATTSGNLAMDANQTLAGQGAVFTLNGLSVAAGTRPTLTGTVTLANADAVTAVNFSGASPALTASAVAMTLPSVIDQVNVTGGTSALSLTNVTATGTGAITVSNASFTNTSAAEVLISGGNLPVTFASNATISSNAGRSIDIQNRTGGTVTFSGAVTDTGTGIFLNANTGSSINFTGALTLNTAANPAFTATGGGTVSVAGSANTIATTTGTALNVGNTTIGASGMTFRSISANGGANGIVLSNTGATAGLTVTGNGGTCTPAAPTCTGGRIQNTVGADNSTATPAGTGIVLNNTSHVSLTRMRLDNHTNYAIRGTSVNGFVFDSGLVDGANGTNVATPFNDGSFVFFGVTGSSSGMTGTSAITNSTIQGGHQRNIAIDNSVGTLNLTVSGNTIRRTSDAAGDDGFFLEADTSANVTLAITNNTFARHGGDHINITMLDNAVVDATITGNTLHGNYTGTPEGNHPIGLGQGIFLFGATFNGTFTYDVSNNGTVAVPFRGNRQGGAINVNKGSGTGTFSGSITNNVIGDPAVVGSGSSEAFGIIVGARGAGGSHTTLINNNQVRQYFDRGIVLEAGEGSAALNATVTNNTLSDFADAVNSLHGIHSDNGIIGGDTNAVCLNISGNSVAAAGNEPAGGADIRVRRGMSTTVSIPGLGGTNNAAAKARLQALNPTATTITVTGNGFSNIASCQIP